jgi:hypothetical protein
MKKTRLRQEFALQCRNVVGEILTKIDRVTLWQWQRRYAVETAV